MTDRKSAAKEFAKHFAEHFAEYLRAAQKVADIDDVEEAFQEAEARLSAKKAEVAGVLLLVNDARARSEEIITAANEEAERLMAQARATCQQMVTQQEQAGRNVISSAMADGERKRLDIERSIASSTVTRDHLMAEIGKLTHERQMLTRAADEEAKALDALKNEMAALKARL